MKKSELTNAVLLVKIETRNALQIMFDALNHGQQKQLLKDAAVKRLFDRYGVAYSE